MLHARTDYQPIQDPRENGIGEDEPVMLFRAKDAFAPLVLRAYADIIRQRADDPEMVQAVLRHAERMEEWQKVNGKQTPDVLPHHYLTDDEDTDELPNPAADDPAVGSPGETPPERTSPPGGEPPDDQKQTEGETEENLSFDQQAANLQTVSSAEAAEAFYGQNPEGTRVVCQKPDAEHRAIVDSLADAVRFFSEPVVSEGEDKVPQATDDLEIKQHPADEAPPEASNLPGETVIETDKT